LANQLLTQWTPVPRLKVIRRLQVQVLIILRISWLRTIKSPIRCPKATEDIWLLRKKCRNLVLDSTKATRISERTLKDFRLEEDPKPTMTTRSQAQASTNPQTQLTKTALFPTNWVQVSDLSSSGEKPHWVQVLASINHQPETMDLM
jgi:hypothetical protein